jgi:molecular chaperone DnaK (HSP70)
MKSAVDVDDAAVQQMVEESVEHAFEDLAARRWVEDALRAREALSATRKGLVDFAEELDAVARGNIETAAAEVEAALGAENAETQIGDTQRLQKANAALDEATRPLAELMMDNAMANMLRKRGLIQ